MSSLIQAVPTSSCNGLELSLPRSLQSSLEEQVCLIATVRLVTPQFLKVSPENVCYCEPVCAGCMWHHDFQQSKQHEEGQMPTCLNSNWLYHHHYTSDLNSGKWIVTWRFTGMSRCKCHDFRMSYGWMFFFVTSLPLKCAGAQRAERRRSRFIGQASTLPSAYSNV